MIVGVNVSRRDDEMLELAPRLQGIGRRTERLPREPVVDGGYERLESIELAAGCGVVVFAPHERPPARAGRLALEESAPRFAPVAAAPGRMAA